MIMIMVTNLSTKMSLDPLEYDLLIQHTTNCLADHVVLEKTPFLLQTFLKIEIRKTRHIILKASTQTSTMEITLKPQDS